MLAISSSYKGLKEYSPFWTSYSKTHSDGGNQGFVGNLFFCMHEISPKVSKMKWLLKLFNCQKWEKGKKNPTFGFQWVAKYIEGWLKAYTSYLVYSQIWLNLPKKDCQFFHIFLWMAGHCGSKSEFLFKKHTVFLSWEIHPLASSRIRDDKWRMHYPLVSSLRHLDEHGACMRRHGLRRRNNGSGARDCKLRKMAIVSVCLAPWYIHIANKGGKKKAKGSE